MTTKPIFSAHPHLLGFERLEALAAAAAREGGGYPPYDIEALSPDARRGAIRITLAVAGFAEDDLSVTVEDRQLVIEGRRPPEDDGRAFLHRGIAARAFRRAFVLAEGVEVADARLRAGLLHIDLERDEPEPVVRRIEIRSDT